MNLFVYGTLQQGYGNNRLLQDATFVGKALTVKPYVLFNCGFPKAVPFTNNEQTHPMLPVMGEVFKVNEATLTRCDLLEGHPDWYRRETIQATLDNGETVSTMIYEMPTWQSNQLCSIIDNVYYLWARNNF